MANGFYARTYDFAARTKARGEEVKSELDALVAGFDKLPTEAQLKTGVINYAVDTGAANAYVVTLPYVPVLADGIEVAFKATNASTGASTLNVNSTGVKSILMADGTAMIADGITAGSMVVARYNGTAYLMTSQSPKLAANTAADAASTAADVITTNADVVLTNADAAATAADLVQTNLDQIQTTSDAADTAADAISTAADAAATAADKISTNADAAATAADRTATNADVVLTNADVVTTGNNVTAAQAAQTAAELALDTVDDLFLGSKTSNPTLDNDGNALLDGARYWNSVSKKEKIYDLGTTTWNEIDNGVGKRTVYIPASAMLSRSTNGAMPATLETTTNKVMVKTLDFLTSVDNFAQFTIKMPKSWNAGTVTAQFLWSHAATTVNFGVRFFIQAVALADGDALDTAFGTAVGHTADTGGTTDDIYITAETAAVTIANTPSKSDYVTFQIYRDVSDAGDTLAIDARLHGVALFITTDAANDA